MPRPSSPTPASDHGQFARDQLADALVAQGAAWKNAADSVRCGGYSNIWIKAGLAAIERNARQVQEDD